MRNKCKFTVFFYAFIMLAIATSLFICDAVFSKHLSYFFPFVGYGGTFRWNYFQMGNIKISLYWSMYLLGIGSMCALSFKRREVCGLNTCKAILTGPILFILGFLGAKILFIIENMSYILENGLELSLGGVSFFGAVFFLWLSVPLVARFLRVDSMKYLDYCTPAVVLMLACIRLGCFMKGCCHGRTVWIGSNPLVYPTQLIECALDLLLLDYLLRAEKDDRFNHGRYFLFMGAYGIIRFFVEFLRDTPKSVLYMSNGQWFSICCIVICAVYMLKIRNDESGYSQER